MLELLLVRQELERGGPLQLRHDIRGERVSMRAHLLQVLHPSQRIHLVSIGIGQEKEKCRFSNGAACLTAVDASRKKEERGK